MFKPPGNMDPKSSGYPYSKKESQLILDEVLYPVIDPNGVPVGFCEVDVKVNNGEEFDCLMVSAHVVHRVEGNVGTVRPFPVWFMFTKGEPREGQKYDWD
jgi:hypothetical protein